ncbi:MAG: hypothetical protein QOJ99_6077, partial [Bryobacterales bacterium]|nr:hypothetical protein [Bryobacterales bacterium]
DPPVIQRGPEMPRPVISPLNALHTTEPKMSSLGHSTD